MVEDDLKTQRLLSAILVAEGLDVDVAGDGELALEMLSRRAYSVVFLDIVLPRISGTAVMEHMRMNMPDVLERVIVVTGLDVSEIRTLFPTVKQALSRPVMPTRLRAMVRAHIPDWAAVADAVVA